MQLKLLIIVMQRFLTVCLLAFLVLTTCQGKSIDELFNNRNATTLSPTECVCTPYYLCEDSGVTNDHDEGLININTRIECESFLEVCCNTKNIIKIEAEKSKSPKSVECGRRNFDGVGFRLTGDISNEAKFGEFPWMVGVMEEVVEGSGKINLYKCGGSLIHPQAVITAAHCVSNITKKYKVRVGEWDTQTTNEIYRHEDRYVKSIVIHPQYHADRLYNDIALLLLENPVDTSLGNIGVICLPPQDAVIPAGTKCLATGWGKDKMGKDSVYQTILKKIDLPFVDRDTCQNNLRNTNLGKHFQLDKSFVCAGGAEGKGTCEGDAGGPLVCPISGKEGFYQQVGIISWGLECGENQTPGVYVNVALFRDWINEKVAESNLTTTSYSY